jgi:ABC-type transport system involved in multi-copper enzyme maturation permease subunit
MKTAWIVMAYTLKDYLASLRLLIGSIVVLFLMVSGACIYSLRYQQELQDYRANRIDADAEISAKSAHVADVVTMDRRAYRKPSPLQFVVDGGEEALPNVIPFTVNVTMSPEREGGENYMLPPFEGIDWDFIVRVILSFVAVALTYDAVSGEKEQGTLRLILSNPVPRDQFITGKFLAALIALSFPLLPGAVISVAVVRVYGGVPVGLSELPALGAHLALSLVYLAFFVLLGIVVSIHARRSASSLVVLLLCWVIVVVAVPGMARPIAVMAREIPTRREFDDQVARILADVLAQYEGQDVSHAPLDVAPVDDSEYRWAEMMERVDAREQEMVNHFWGSKLAQAELARAISMISPAGLYRFAGQDIVGTGLRRQREFLSSVNDFRGELADFGREVDARDPRSPHILYRAWYMSQEPVDPDAVPRFRDAGGGGDGLEAGLGGGLWLFAEALIFFALAHIGFLRSDVR